MAAIQGYREQIFANFDFMGFEQEASDVEVIVDHFEDVNYHAFIIDRLTYKSVPGCHAIGTSPEKALGALLDRTSRYLAENPPTRSDADIAPEQAATAVIKFSKGRPPKPVPAQAESLDFAPKRGRGRPRKSNADSSALAGLLTSAAELPPSPMDDQPVDAPIKRGRGRPRKSGATVPVVPSDMPKSPVPDQSLLSTDAAPTTSAVKRGRGRPRKSDTGATTATPQGPVIKRGRGRPRKSDITSIPTTAGAKRPASDIQDADADAMRPATKTPRTIGGLEPMSSSSLSTSSSEADLLPAVPSLPAYITGHARIVYECIKQGTLESEGMPESLIIEKTELAPEDVRGGIATLQRAGGIYPTDDLQTWALLNMWTTEES